MLRAGSSDRNNLERGSLGVYPIDGPIPGKTTTLESPVRFGFIGYASVASRSPNSTGSAWASTWRVWAPKPRASSSAKQQAVVNEVRRLYHGIAQAESGRKTLQATVGFLQQLEQADLLNVKAQLA
jgi:hypothetical protein